jgi:hypothetical protein
VLGVLIAFFKDIIVAHPSLLASQPTEPSRIELNDELHRHACQGDASAKQALIENNLALVKFKVDSFIRSRPDIVHLKDDLISAGSLGLVEAVDQLCQDPTIEKPSAYIAATITNAFSALLEGEVLIYYSRHTRRRARGTTRRLPEHTTFSEAANLSASEDESKLFEIRDLVESCCKSGREQELIRLRQNGLSTEECATTLGMGRASAFRMLKTIERRFNAKIKACQ